MVGDTAADPADQYIISAVKKEMDGGGEVRLQPMFWTYEERREQAREGRGIAAFVSSLHLVLDWLRSRAFQPRDASASKQVGWISADVARCCRDQGEAAEAVARLGR
jgi:hypothetical protein